LTVHARVRHWAARSSHPAATGLRGLRQRLRRFTLPAPRVLVRPLLWVFVGLRAGLYFLRSKLIAEPLLKAYCSRYGKGVTAGIYVPWVLGHGELVLGDYVRFSGLIEIRYAASFVARPRLEIGDYSDIAHNTSFVIGREIRIGRHVQIADGVSLRDSGGHASDPALRLAGAPPADGEVRPIVVHDNVWIGSGALIMPGSEIGEGSIVAARAVVSGKVAAYTVVAGNPARRIGVLTRSSAVEHTEVSTAAQPTEPPAA
jgi:acetyltransferase-like isoleucine patch superfamily enzyme